MQSRFWISASLLAGALLLPAQAAPAPPPGPNVHLVRERNGNRFWRGGGPRKPTLEALAADARKRGVTLTLIDLRTPANKDDRSGKDGRLAPAHEEALARQLGAKYLPLNALDRSLPKRIDAALQQGDVYMHCMYGVNRTGFATARYARDAGIEVTRKGLGKRDWNQGDAFQANLQRAKR